MSRPEPTTRRMTRGQPGGRWPGSLAACAARVSVPRLIIVSRQVIVSVRFSVAAAGAPGGGDFVPHPAGEVQAVALGLPGSGVADVGVQRVPVEGGLYRTIRPLD